jgi:regulator of protease activity HflC (stomatin/prohibitin superfamily)
VPFADQLRPLIGLREQVVSFPPQPVITWDNLVVGIDTVIYFQITDPKAATYEIASYVAGLRVSRVELKAIEPPTSIQGSMEKQMRADRDKRAAILSAEGAKQSAILTAEGERQAAVLRARCEAQAIATVFQAIHEGKPDQRLLAYKYLEMLPEIAQGGANKLWIVPSELGKALEGRGGLFGGNSAPGRSGLETVRPGSGTPCLAR